MKTINKIETGAAGLVMERSDARGIAANPKEATTQPVLEKVL